MHKKGGVRTETHTELEKKKVNTENPELRQLFAWCIRKPERRK